jgi:hypothetical protein
MFTRENYASAEGEKKDCSVRAYAVAACVSYSSAWELFNKFGREPNKGTPNFITEKVIKDQFPNALYRCFPWDIRPTLPKFAERANEGHWVVHVRGHALAIVDGVIHDWKPRPKTKVWCAWRIA